MLLDLLSKRYIAPRTILSSIRNLVRKHRACGETMQTQHLPWAEWSERWPEWVDETGRVYFYLFSSFHRAIFIKCNAREYNVAGATWTVASPCEFPRRRSWSSRAGPATEGSRIRNGCGRNTRPRSGRGKKRNAPRRSGRRRKKGRRGKRRRGRGWKRRTSSSGSRGRGSRSSTEERCSRTSWNCRGIWRRSRIISPARRPRTSVGGFTRRRRSRRVWRLVLSARLTEPPPPPPPWTRDRARDDKNWYVLFCSPAQGAGDEAAEEGRGARKEAGAELEGVREVAREFQEQTQARHAGAASYVKCSNGQITKSMRAHLFLHRCKITPFPIIL